MLIIMLLSKLICYFEGNLTPIIVHTLRSIFSSLLSVIFLRSESPNFITVLVSLSFSLSLVCVQYMCVLVLYIYHDTYQDT